jgi:serine/alanine adding enzyme
MVRILEDPDIIRWDRFVMEASDSTCYHLSGWKNVIEKSFGHKTYYLFAEDGDGQIHGILPLVNLNSFLFGNFMISMPYFNYGGICADREEAAAELLDAAIDIAEKQKAAHIELRHSLPMKPEMPSKTSKVSMRLKLTEDTDELWKSFSSKLRSQIRRPAKEGMHASLGGEEKLDDFYSVFAANMRDLGTPVYGKYFFRNILGEFPESTRICVVHTKAGKAVASGFLVGFKQTLEIPWASSLKSHNSYSPNMLLYWTSIKYACESGHHTFDFGRSTPGEGTFRFKEQWGSEPVQLYWNYWLRNGGAMPELNPHNPKYRLAISVWRKLPLSLTKLLGPSIVRNLP